MGGLLSVIKIIEQLFSKKPASDSKKVYGNIGRLEIPELNISVPLNDTKVDSAQKVVDMNNSAVYLRWPTQRAIADHSNQANFRNLNRARVGKTILYIDKYSSRKEYVCVKSQVGHIKTDGQYGNEIYDANWESTFYQNSGGLCVYTCIAKSAPNVMDIRLTYWQPV